MTLESWENSILSASVGSIESNTGLINEEETEGGGGEWEEGRGGEKKRIGNAIILRKIRDRMIQNFNISRESKN